MDRITTTQRVLHYLSQHTSERYPEWRSITIDFFGRVVDLSVGNPALNLNFLKSVGLTAYYKDRTIFYARLGKRSMTVNLHPDWVLVPVSDAMFARKLQTEWYRSYLVDSKAEVHSLVAFLGRLKKPSQSYIRNTRTVPQWVKNYVLERDGGRCRSCGSKTALCFDHILPYAKGGLSDHPNNIQLLCARCNSRKSDLIL